MKKTYKIALMGEGLSSWDGGIDHLTFIANSLEHVNRLKKDIFFDVFLILPRENALYSYVRKKLKGWDEDRKQQRLIDSICDVCPSVKLKYYYRFPRKIYDDKGKNLERLLIKLKADICFPVLSRAYPDMKVPWLGFIPDFQEKYLPDMFSEEELKRRDSSHEYLVKNTKYFYVSSKNVAEDMRKFFPGNYEIFLQPYLPIVRDSYLDTSDADLSKYNLPEKYFIVCNQFWPHKNHSVLFKAMGLLIREYPEVQLLCTGRTDYSDENKAYFESLKNLIEELGIENNVKFLGFIPKKDQIELMKRSVALVQPSLFEGNPGGCSVYDALSISKRVIAADIPVNRELESNDLVKLFDVSNEYSLKDVMHGFLEYDNNYPSASDMAARDVGNSEILMKFYKKMLMEIEK